MAQERDETVVGEAPRAPRRSARFYLLWALAFIGLVWSFQGAKIRLAELLQGVPQIFITVGRMLPPDFSKVTDPESYFFPDSLSASELFLPLPLDENRARARQRWWDNTFPQTILGATLETVQMALAGTSLALVGGFSPGFSRRAQHYAPSLGV